MIIWTALLNVVLSKAISGNFSRRCTNKICQQHSCSPKSVSTIWNLENYPTLYCNISFCKRTRLFTYKYLIHWIQDICSWTKFGSHSAWDSWLAPNAPRYPQPLNPQVQILNRCQKLSVLWLPPLKSVIKIGSSTIQSSFN